MMRRRLPMNRLEGTVAALDLAAAVLLALAAAGINSLSAFASWLRGLFSHDGLTESSIMFDTTRG